MILLHFKMVLFEKRRSEPELTKTVLVFLPWCKERKNFDVSRVAVQYSCVFKKMHLTHCQVEYN